VENWGSVAIFSSNMAICGVLWVKMFCTLSVAFLKLFVP